MEEYENVEIEENFYYSKDFKPRKIDSDKAINKVDELSDYYIDENGDEICIRYFDKYMNLVPKGEHVYEKKYKNIRNVEGKGKNGR